MSCLAVHDLPGADYKCEKMDALDPKGVFLNALADDMPECDRVLNMARLDEVQTATSCYVYCAQRSCGAAKTFLERNADALFEKCTTVSYLHGGALEMRKEDLVDGEMCHRNILDSNAAKGLHDGCVTCDEKEATVISMTINDQPVTATYVTTDSTPPDWYLRNGIVGSLPTQFSCDERYKYPLQMHDSQGRASVKLDISKTDLPSGATIAFWAAHSNSSAVMDADAYGSFDNSGIVKCENSICDFHMDVPGRYSSEGKVYKQHLHLTEWLGDHWNLVAKTVDLE